MLQPLDDLYRYNDWANDKVFALCEGLRDEQLDQPREMGFGSLRATLFHILVADQIWLERWLGKPWRTFPTGPDGISLADIQAGLKSAAASRRALIEEHRNDGWKAVIRFQDSKQTPYERQLYPLLLHVANHGIHHRAQALSFLKSFGRKVPGGIDYLFYRLAHTTVEQAPASLERFRAFGLEAACAQGDEVAWDASTIKLLYRYNDWANDCIHEMASPLTDSELDRDFNMGPGSIRSTLLHMHDAEHWWLKTWTEGPTPFPQSDKDTSIAQWAESYRAIRENRNAYFESVDEAESQRVVMIDGGGGQTGFRVVESALQLFGHGSHHRAQLINMLRHSGATIRNLDLLYAPEDILQLE